MKQIFRAFILVSCLSNLMVCKGNFPDRVHTRSENANSANPEGAKGKPDKLSEEPVGLPGYPLACRWQNVPTESTPTANVRCFLTDERGQPTDLGAGALWAVEALTPEVAVTQQVIGSEFHISVSGSTDTIVVDALRILQVHVKYGAANSLEKKASISDLLKAPNNAFRLASTCDTEFVTIISREEDSIMVGPAFTGCVDLAAALNNRTLPDPSQNSAFLASCEESTFRFDPIENGQPEVIESDLILREYCLELAIFINSKGEQ
ncbi:MAG: hypothetical protein M3Q07_26040 [Pseudobdellovibrionaceae bacterium]|nr:hypothetical protein [Pseudobdellovibrionaceae bacterium]